VVAHGVSEDAFDVMDTGRSRNAADVPHIYGYPSQNALAAAARGLMFVERYGRVFPTQRDSHLYVTPVTTLQYVKDHPEIIEGVRLADRIYHSGIQGGIGRWAILMTLFLRLDPQQAEQFAEHLTSGAGLQRGHPVLMLRNRLLGSQRDRYSTLSGREALVAIAIKSTSGAHVARRGTASGTVSRASLTTRCTRSGMLPAATLVGCSVEARFANRLRYETPLGSVPYLRREHADEHPKVVRNQHDC
jgi:hypothetical protein